MNTKPFKYIGDIISKDELSKINKNETLFINLVALSKEDPFFTAVKGSSEGTTICNSKGCIVIPAYIKLGTKLTLNKIINGERK